MLSQPFLVRSDATPQFLNCIRSTEVYNKRMNVARRLLLWGAILSSLPAGPGRAAAADEPDALFRRLRDQLVQVRLVDRASGSKSIIGSGFFVRSDGLLLTNYHVISELLYRPKQYDVELRDESGTAVALELVDVDVVHDLAVLKAPSGPARVLQLLTEPLEKGRRLFALGNPYDLGSSIVEGTYNGLLENSLYEKIHFTGPINPGMSGGPAVTGDGSVVGINVATAGNAVSFLVPSRFAVPLLERTAASTPEALRLRVKDQLLEHQRVVIEDLLDAPFERIRLGDYELPGKLGPFLNCWGGTVKDEDEPYETVSHQCGVEDAVYVAAGLSSGTIGFQHTLLTSNELNPLRFFALYQNRFAAAWSPLGGRKEHVGPFACTTDFVDREGSTFRVVYCLRAYRKLPGLYDAVLKAASLDSNRTGVQTTLTLSGVSYENAQRFARRYLESIRCKVG